jgi:cytochrome c peroxidase
MTKTTLISLVLISLVVLSCNNSPKTTELATPVLNKDSLMGVAAKMFAVLPTEAPNPNNALSPEKIALGKALYYDKLLSKDQTQSCNTCHNLETFGVDNLPTSKGDNGAIGTRNSPTVLNAALHIAQFWDGRNKDVEEQAGGPVMNPVEMGMPSEKIVISRLKENANYKAMFAAAFPGEKDPINFKNMTFAIGAFERTLLTPSKFDEFLAGNKDALSDEEVKGLKTFMDAGCTTCHSSALLGGNMFMKFGLSVNYWELTKSEVIDSGKYVVTKNAADMFVFKTPSLRNIEMTYPYFHDGSVTDLKESIQIMAKTELNKELSPAEVEEISTFLKTLNGKVAESALMPKMN